MDKYVIELQVDFPGKEYARVGYDIASGAMKLLEVVYPDTCLPVDMCSVPNTCTESMLALPAILIRNIALPPGCRVQGRPVALFRFADGNTNQSIPVCVPESDPAFQAVAHFDDLSSDQRLQIIEFLQQNDTTSSQPVIESAQAAWALITAAKKKYRLQQTRSPKSKPASPAWQPVASHVIYRLNGEGEHYSDSEYDYWHLPRRFQKYIEEYLQRNERILYSIHRPAMRSAMVREFFTGKRFEESVMLISDPG